jgi:hypothetical protein
MSFAHSLTRHAPTYWLVPFSEPPSVTTWLENAPVRLVAFSEPPSVTTWLENAPA